MQTEWVSQMSEMMRKLDGERSNGRVDLWRTARIERLNTSRFNFASISDRSAGRELSNTLGHYCGEWVGCHWLCQWLLINSKADMATRDGTSQDMSP